MECGGGGIFYECIDGINSIVIQHMKLDVAWITPWISNEINLLLYELLVFLPNRRNPGPETAKSPCKPPKVSDN